MQIDYYAYHSGMRNWNAEVKVLLAVGTLFLTVLLDRITVSLFVVMTMGILTLRAGRIPWRVYLHFMMVPLTFMIFSSAVIAAQLSAQPVGEWNFSLHFFYLCVTERSLFTSVKVLFKAMAGVSALYMMTFSTPVNEVISVLQKMRLPRLLAELMNLIYRYIFILFDVAHQMQTAAKARLGYRNFIQSCRSFAGIAGNLFLISLKKAGIYYDALLARGYDGKLEFLVEEMPVKRKHIIFSILYFILLLLTALVRI